MKFKELLMTHIDAMVNKDYEGFIKTVSEEAITLIMPNGHLIDTYEGFCSLHKEWFEDEDWAIEYEIRQIIETTSLSTALLSIHYTDVDEKNDPLEMYYYLNLVFKLCDNQWQLVFDQNTIFKH